MRRALLLSLLATAAAVAQNPPSVLKGGGVEVTVDLKGFKQELGPERIHDGYYRLSQFSTLPGEEKAAGGYLIGSLLVDELPADPKSGTRSPDLALIGLNTAFPKMYDILFSDSHRTDATFGLQRVDSPDGLLYHYIEAQDLHGKKLYQFQAYFETAMAGKWIEAHFSVSSDQPVFDAPTILQKVRSVISTLKAQPSK